MNSPHLPADAPDTLPALLAERVRSTPDADALRCGGTRLSYRELDRRAGLLAHRLRRAGVGPDVPVGIHLHRSVELAVALFGVLKAGGACVPLDPAYPAERLAFVLGDVGAPVLLTTAGLAGRLPGHTGRVLLVEETGAGAPSKDTAGSAAEDRAATGAPPHPEHLGWIAYTSGSTGRPKGVPLGQGALAALARGIADRLDLTEADRVLQFASIGFSVAAEEVLSTWAAGACLVMDPDGELADSARLLTLIEREGVSVLQLTPSYWYEWLRELDREQGPAAPPTLRLLVVGSEPVAVDRVADWCATGVRLVQEYGATEATVSQLLYETEAGPGEIRGWDRLPIGTPLPGGRAHVLNDRMEPVPDGEAGELYLGGPGVSRGYLGLPALTADRFLPDPFTDRPGGRMYRTRDLARRLPGGALEFLGRIDYQLNIRGIRIEPGEVENAIGQFPGILESAALARPDDSGAEQLVACVVWAGEPRVRALRARLREVLPPALVPARFAVLPALPLNANGKVDRQALRTLPLDLVSGRTGTGAGAPRTPLQAALTEVWEKVLGIAPIGPDDDFFELGGDSLTAVRLAAACRTRLGADVRQPTLFQAPTVAALAAELEGAAPALVRPEPAPASGPADGGARPGPAPASFAQQRMWVLHKLAPGSPRFNEPVVLRLAGELDAAALRTGLGTLVARHEALRTVFATEDGLPVQVPRDPYEPELPLLDLTGRGEDEAAEAVARLVREPFDLTRGPLLRASLVRLGPEHHLLVLVLHHIVFDGGSMEVLFDELGPLYAAAAAGTDAGLPAPALAYADWAREQHRQAAEQGHDEQLAYWRKQLAGAPETTRLPAAPDGPAPARDRGGPGAVHTFSVPAPLTARLRDLAGAERATLFMVLLSAFHEQVHRATGARDLVVGTLTSGRDRPELDSVMGMFVNTLCLRTELEPGQPFRRLLSSVRRTVREALAHQDVPFERVVEELRPARGRGHSLLFQLMFSFGSTPSRGPELPGLATSVVPCDTGTAKFDLTLALDEDGAGGLAGRLEHDLDRIGAAAARDLAEDYLALLERAAADPGHRVGAG
ncbi:amino acid adenylation domain-containing protein [Streptomyces albidoflavus]|uniref:non-ribosomal peptide synthetase n=1 Tax=Streptomyces albidoflavus TaxID=1886 RepID=UPI000FF6CB8E|nr:non-ribosomal peptide synthetase [Streptomyces albidoflavus]RWZ77951.1 amino acid adenylation domain-containing protein [Streptomyces albidoflavus]